MSNFSPIYEEVHRLLEEQSKQDETEPYKSKYAARELLSGMKSFYCDRLDAIENQTENADALNLKSQLAGILLQLGIIGIETEELSTGQEHLEKAIQLISGLELSSLFVCTIILCHNHLAVLWSQRDEQKKAEKHLLLAREIYSKYKDKDQVEAPLAIHELFGCHFASVPEGWEALEKFHTLTLYYLAQVMGQLGQSSESAHLCLTTLHRQLTSCDYNMASWAINAATLAKFYHNNSKFRVARRLLAAAWTMLTNTCDESPNLGQEKLREMKAEVSRRFGSYCLELLSDSSEDLHPPTTQSEEASDPPCQENESLQYDSLTADNPCEEDCLEKMEFVKLELDSIEKSVEWRKAKNYEEARNLFMAGLRWYNDAQKFFCLEDHASVYTNIVQEISSLYKLLASFEESTERRNKMHKRRVDMLTAVRKELNPQYYLLVNRQLDYELGETYSAMVDCKYALLGGSSSIVQRANKINNLVSKGIEHFQDYLDTFKVDGKTPEKYPDESARPVLIAYFHLGRLWSKKISGEVRGKLEFMSRTKDNYQYIVDYCDAHPECCDLVTQELPLCREMAELIPIKMEQIRSRS